MSDPAAQPSPPTVRALVERFKPPVGISTYGTVFTDSTEFMNITYGDVIKVGGRHYLVLGDERERRFGMEDPSSGSSAASNWNAANTASSSWISRRPSTRTSGRSHHLPPQRRQRGAHPAPCGGRPPLHAGRGPPRRTRQHGARAQARGRAQARPEHRGSPRGPPHLLSQHLSRHPPALHRGVRGHRIPAR